MSAEANVSDPAPTSTDGAVSGFKFFDERRNPAPSGLVDRFIRRFRFTAHLAAILCLYAVGALAVGLALAPALYFLRWALPFFRRLDGPVGWIGQGASLGVAFFIAGFSLLVVVPVYNWAAAHPREAVQGRLLHHRTPCPGSCTTGCSTWCASPSCPS